MDKVFFPACRYVEQYEQKNKRDIEELDKLLPELFKMQQEKFNNKKVIL